MHSGASGFISHGSYWITEHFLNFLGSHELEKKYMHTECIWVHWRETKHLLLIA